MEKILNHFLISNLEIICKNKLIEYIEFCLNNSVDKKIKGKTELHHILPKKLFEEYSILSDNKWNGAHLSYENHYIAHSLLAEAISNKTISFAWIAMNNKNKMSGEKILGAYNYAKLKEKAHYFNVLKELDETQGKTFCDTSGLTSAILKETNEKVHITSDEYKNNKHLYKTQSSGKITAKDWDGNTFQINKDDTRYLSGEIGGVTANRCIFISPKGIEYKTMNITKLIKELNLAPVIKNYKNKGVISYEPTSSNKLRYSKFVDINGWELKVLDKPIIKGKYKNAR